LYCGTRLVVARRLGRRNHDDVNVAHVLMGVAMAGMLVPGWKVVADGVWETVFLLIAVWFAARSVRFVTRHGVAGTDDDHVHHLSHYLIHMVMACAMLYMYAVGASTHGPTMVMRAGVAPAGDPALALLLVAVLLGSAVWQLDAMPRLAAAPGTVSSTVGGAEGWAVSPERPGGPTLPGPTPPGTMPLLAPRLEVGCHVVMCVTMGYMLILML
jgi:hypothetical protein